MVKGKSGSFFWPSYTDLMTSMFFIMLVLYVLTYVLLKHQQSEIQLKADQYDRLLKIEKSINEIDKEEKYFEYNETYKKHIMKIQTSFKTNSDDINDMTKGTQNDLLVAGQKIVNLISNIKNNEQIKYLVIIEGQASKDNQPINDELSYRRALSLKKFWRKNKLILENLENCELLVAGSGQGGFPRALPDKPPANQRFLIHIIPKPGRK